jgi:hypothetical protein
MEQQISDIIRGHADIAIGPDGPVILNAEKIAAMIVAALEKSHESKD